MTDEELTEYAATLVLDAARSHEYTDIFDMAEDCIGREISDEDAKKVWDLMVKATVSVVIGGVEFEGQDDDDEDGE